MTREERLAANLRDPHPIYGGQLRFATYADAGAYLRCRTAGEQACTRIERGTRRVAGEEIEIGYVLVLNVKKTKKQRGRAVKSI
jgi:hypothetical protein